MEATTARSGLNISAAIPTARSPVNFTALVSFPLAALQVLMVPSLAPEMIRLPSALAARARISASCAGIARPSMWARRVR